MGCIECLSRTPYATLIATVLCCVGVGIFLGSLYRAAALTLSMFINVFKFDLSWLNDIRDVFIIIGAIMGLLSLILLLVGFLATGATREKIYSGWKARMGGRVTCAILMVLTYILNFVWLLVMCCLVVVTCVFSMFWGVCNHLGDNDSSCIDFTQFSFMFPPDTSENYLKICGGERKSFCKDCVEPAEIMFILSLTASVLVIISLTHYLMCLAANYARIKDHEKFRDLQELQHLQEFEGGTLPKARF